MYSHKEPRPAKRYNPWLGGVYFFNIFILGCLKHPLGFLEKAEVEDVADDRKDTGDDAQGSRDVADNHRDDEIFSFP